MTIHYWTRGLERMLWSYTAIPITQHANMATQHLTHPLFAEQGIQSRHIKDNPGYFRDKRAWLVSMHRKTLRCGTYSHYR